jgi:two-component system sensor histidine kinase QseC
MAISNMSPLVYATLLLGILISVTIRTGLKPLKALSSRLKSREVTDFDPINLADCPDELIPIQQTINRSLKQVESLLLREKRFSSDAAHELRTPISNLKVRMHNLMTNHKDMSGELKQLETGVDRLSHVVEQILTLNRTHIDNVTQQFLPLDLDSLCQKVIMELYEQIEARQHSIELIAEPSFISGNMFALHSMISNLITNAVKYTPAGGQINITVKQQGSEVIVTISDSGPGIPESEYIRITDRFYRLHGDQNDSDVIGCGLGMSIIKQVVDLHDGTILFDRDESLGGLKVTLVFPATKDA